MMEKKLVRIFLVIALLVLTTTRIVHAEENKVYDLEVNLYDGEMYVEYISFNTKGEMIQFMEQKVEDEINNRCDVSVYAEEEIIGEARAAFSNDCGLASWVNLSAIDSDGANADVWYSIDNTLDHTILVIDR